MKRGNPNWGKPQMGPANPTLSEFEQIANKFRLRPNEYVESGHLRQWAEHNCNSRYVPEHLLKAWKIRVNCTV